ncbi:MAG TPA: hypothetical protein VN281_07090, partial [Verrucomicrobiae bacterium]|nr:hypothetical protein [Verrucomicrobiae bacterium]
VVVAIAAIVSCACVHPALWEKPLVTLGNALVRVVFLAVIVGCLLVLRNVRELKLQLLLRVSLLLLFWFDVRTHAPQFQPSVIRAAYEPDLIRAYFQANFNWGESVLKPGDSRASRSIRSAVIMLQSWIDDPEKEVYGRRLSMAPNCNLLEHASLLDGFFSLELQNYSEFYKWFLTHTPTNDMPGLKNFLGVALVTDPTNNVNWLPREGHLPAVTTGQEAIFADDQDTLERLVSNEFDPVHQVYLPPEAKPSVIAKRAEARILASKFANEHVDAEVEASAPTMMVIAQIFHSSWRAYVDDRPAPLWRANYAFQALEIPAGRHKVRLVYEDRPFQIGGIISVGTLALCIAGLLMKRKDIQLKAAENPDTS